MGAGSYSKGWGGADDYDSYGDGDGDNGGGGGKMTDLEKLFKFRFGIPTPEGKPKKPNLVPGRPAVKRVLILDGEPFCVHEHSLYNFTGAWKILDAFSALCLAKNGLGRKGCPMCAKDGGDNYPYFIGFFPVIDMGQVEYAGKEVILHHEYWEDKKNEKHYREFERKLLGAKRGSQDKPGVLKTLQFQMERRGGDLTGTIWDVTRTGDKTATVGDAWEYVDKIRPEDFAAYLQKFGADPDHLNLEIPIFHNPEIMNNPDAEGGLFDLKLDSEKEPSEYYAKLAQIVGWGGRQGGQRQESQAGGAGFGGGGEDDDIPF